MCDYNTKIPIYLTNNIINYLLYYFYVSLLLSFVLFLLDSRFRMWPPTQLIVLWSLHIIVLNNSVFIITHYYAVVQISIIFTFINANWCFSVKIILSILRWLVMLLLIKSVLLSLCRIRNTNIIFWCFCLPGRMRTLNLQCT